MYPFAFENIASIYRNRKVQIVWYFLGMGIMGVLFAFLFVWKIFGANFEFGFTSFINGADYVFETLFVGVFSAIKVAGSVFEWTTLLAIFVFWVLVVSTIKLLFIGKQYLCRRPQSN